MNKRFNTIVNTLVNHGTARFRGRFIDEYQIKSVYRFMSPEKVTFSGIESSEQSRLYDVLRDQKPPLLIHVQDTTTLNYSTKKSRYDMPCLNYINHRGYFLHNSILLDEKGNVLGLSQQELWGRTETELGRRREPRSSMPIECQETERFVRHYRDFECLMESFPTSQGRSVCDREGDFYDLLAAKSVSNVDLWVRVHHDRLIKTLSGTSQKLLTAVQQAPSQGEYWTEILVKGSTHRTRPVCLTVQSCPIWIGLPESLKWSKNTPKAAKKRVAESQELLFWVVKVTEKNPPMDTEPIEWTLLTSRPVKDYWDALQMVQIYKLRWIIEMFHRTLKQGYAIEELQLQTAHRIQNAVALFSLAAIQITRFRYASIFAADTPLTQWGFKTMDFNTLVLYLNRNYHFKLPFADELNPPSIQQFCKIIHLMAGGKRNQPIGIRSLWKGWHQAQMVINAANLFRSD